MRKIKNALRKTVSWADDLALRMVCFWRKPALLQKREYILVFILVISYGMKKFVDTYPEAFFRMLFVITFVIVPIVLSPFVWMKFRKLG